MGGRRRAGAVATQQVVASGQQLVDPNGNIQQCSTAGTTGAAAPTWATALNATTADGTAVWKLVTVAGTLLQAPTLVNFTANPNIAGSAAALRAADPGLHRFPTRSRPSRPRARAR